MNKHTAIGIAFEAAVSKKRIIVVVPRQIDCREALDIFMQTGMVSDENAKVRRANGNERIDFRAGGTIIFKSAHQTPRGYSADVIHVDEDVVRHTFTPEQWRQWQLNVIPGHATSKSECPEIVIGC